MKLTRSHHLLNRCLLIGLLVFAGRFTALSQQNYETRGAALKREMYEMEKKAFSDYEVQPEAQKRMDELIERAVASYNQKPVQESHNRIIENFQNLLNTTAMFRNSYMHPQLHKPAMIMMAAVFAKSGAITVQSIEKALKKLCPLWPFC